MQHLNCSVEKYGIKMLNNTYVREQNTLNDLGYAKSNKNVAMRLQVLPQNIP